MALFLFLSLILSIKSSDDWILSDGGRSWSWSWMVDIELRSRGFFCFFWILFGLKSGRRSSRRRRGGRVGRRGDYRGANDDTSCGGRKRIAKLGAGSWHWMVGVVSCNLELDRRGR